MRHSTLAESHAPPNITGASFGGRKDLTVLVAPVEKLAVNNANLVARRAMQGIFDTELTVFRAPGAELSVCRKLDFELTVGLVEEADADSILTSSKERLVEPPRVLRRPVGLSQTDAA